MNGYQTVFGVGNAYDAYVAVIDTTQVGAAGLVYSTYLGGTGTDMGMGIAYAGNRIVYVTGEADTGFPTANALDASFNGGNSDAFIAKIDTSQAGAASLLYSTFLGGSTSDLGWDIAVDPQGIVHLVGETNSTDFPQVAAISTHINLTQPFVAKLNASGATLLFSSYFAGGGNGKWAMGVATNAAGDTFIGGYTNNPPTNPSQPTGFPIANPRQGVYGGGGSDAFVSRIGNSGDLILTKTASPEPVTTNNTVTYTLTIGNLSTDPALNVTLTDPLPAGVTFATCVVDGRRRVRRLGQQPHRHVRLDRRPRVGDGDDHRDGHRRHGRDARQHGRGDVVDLRRRAGEQHRHRDVAHARREPERHRQRRAAERLGDALRPRSELRGRRQRRRRRSGWGRPHQLPGAARRGRTRAAS